MVKMKVVLLQNIQSLGKAGDIVDVKDGYAVNYLIPNKLALPGTKHNISVAMAKKRKLSVLKEKAITGLKQLYSRLNKKEFAYITEKSKSGGLKERLTNNLIISFLEKKLDISKDFIIRLASKYNIKDTGKHIINFIIKTNITGIENVERSGNCILDVRID